MSLGQEMIRVCIRYISNDITIIIINITIITIIVITTNMTIIMAPSPRSRLAPCLIDHNAWHTKTPIAWHLILMLMMFGNVLVMMIRLI